MGSKCCKKQKVLDDEEDDKPESTALDVNVPSALESPADQALMHDASHEGDEKEGKDAKGGGEGIEGKEGHEGSEGKEGHEGSEGKEDKEGSDGKVDKEGSDGKGEGEGEIKMSTLTQEPSSAQSPPPETKIIPENATKKRLKGIKKEKHFKLPNEGKYELLPPAPNQCTGIISDEQDKVSAFMFEVPRIVGMAAVDKMVKYPKLNRLYKDCTGEVFSNTRKGNETVAFCIQSPKNSQEDALCAAKTFISVDMPMLQNHLLNLDHDIFDKSMTREEQRAMLEKGRFAFFPEKPIWEKYSECLIRANKKRLLKLRMR